MHLAYFATEITLHRCIIRSFENVSPGLSTPTPTPSSSTHPTIPPSSASNTYPPSSPRSPSSPTSSSTTTTTTTTTHNASHAPRPSASRTSTTPTPTYLAHICRAAAKTRLISAMDFANRLRPAHLRAFWYFPARASFALVGAFGALLLATAPCAEEVDFYRTRLGEYRWTLGVSARVAPFLAHAAGCLDRVEGLLGGLPRRPRGVELGWRGSGTEEGANGAAPWGAPWVGGARLVGSPPRDARGRPGHDTVILDDDDEDDDDDEVGVAKAGACGDLAMRMEADEGAVSAVVGPSGPSGLVSPSTSTGSGSGYEAFVESFPMES